MRHTLDVMHVEKNVAATLIGVPLGRGRHDCCPTGLGGDGRQGGFALGPGGRERKLLNAPCSVRFKTGGEEARAGDYQVSEGSLGPCCKLFETCKLREREAAVYEVA